MQIRILEDIRRIILREHFRGKGVMVGESPPQGHFTTLFSEIGPRASNESKGQISKTAPHRAVAGHSAAASFFPSAAGSAEQSKDTPSLTEPNKYDHFLSLVGPMTVEPSDVEIQFFRVARGGKACEAIRADEVGPFRDA